MYRSTSTMMSCSVLRSRGRARARPRSRSRALAQPVTVAVDVNGADLGPAEVARGAAHAAGRARDPVRPGRRDRRRCPSHVSVVDAPVSIAKEADPARAVRRTPEASIVRAVAAVAAGEADALVSGGSTGAALAASLFGFKRARGVHRPGAGDHGARPGQAVPAARRGRERRGPAGDLVQFAHMGAAFMEAVGGVASPRVALLANGTEATKGTEIVVAAHAVLAAHRGPELRRQRRGVRDRHRRRGRDRRRRLHRQRGAEGDGGSSAALLGAVRGAALSSLRAKVGGLLLQARAARAAGRARPGGAGRRRAARAAAASASSRTARSGRAGSPARSRWRPAACARTWPVGPTPASPTAGALRSGVRSGR